MKSRGWSGKGTGKRKPPPIRWWVLPLVFIAVSLAVMLLSPRGSVPPMDDTYIHLVFGGSLLSSEPLSFNPGESSSGFTAPLWLIPSALASLAGTDGGPVVLMILSLLFAAAAVAVCEWRTSLLLVLTGPILFHSTSGMETMAACLMIAVLWRSIRDGSITGWRPWILAAALLLRPELAVLALPLGLVTWKRGWKSMAYLLAPSLALGGLWAVWNLGSTGGIFPATFYAKQSSSWLSAAGSGLPGLLKGLAVTSVLLPFAAAVSTVSLIRGYLTKVRLTGFALAGFPILLTIAALASQPNAYFQLRYFVPAIFAWILVSGQWLSVIPRWKSNLAILSLSLVPGLVIFAGRRGAATSDVGAIDVDPAIWLAENAAPTEVVAAADIGALRWLTGLEVLDLDGLVTQEMLPGNDGGWTYIEANADYLLAFPEQYSDLRKDGIGSLDFLIGFGSPSSVICGEDSVAIWAIR